MIESRNKVIQKEKEKEEINWELWSSLSQQQFTTILKLPYKRADVFLLTFSINNRESFDLINDLYKFIQMKIIRNVLCVLVGCKCDLESERVVGKAEAMEFSVDNQIEYIEVSGMKNINVNELFELILRKLEEKDVNKEEDIKRKSIVLNKVSSESKKKRADCGQ